MKYPTILILTLMLLSLSMKSFGQSNLKIEIIKEKSGKFSLVNNQTKEVINKYKNCGFIDSIYGLKLPTNQQYRDFIIIQKGKALIIYSISKEKEISHLLIEEGFSISFAEVEVESNEVRFGRIDPTLTRNYITIYLEGKKTTTSLLFNFKSGKFISAISSSNYNRKTYYELINQDLILVSHDGTKQVIDNTGKKIVPLETDNFFHRFNGGFAFINDDFKYGIVNYQGDTIASFIYEKAQASPKDNFVILENSDEKAGVINSQGKIIIPFIYKPIHPNYYRGYDYSDYGVFMLYKKNYADSNFVFIDTNGVELIKENSYQNAWELDIPYQSIYNDRYYFVKKKYVGVYDTKQKKEIIPCEFSFFKDKDDTKFGVISARDQQGNWGLLSLENGSTIIPFEYESNKTEIIKTSDSLLTYILSKNGQFGLINQRGKIQLPFEYSNIVTTSYKNFVIVEKKGIYGLFNCSTSSIVIPVELKTIDTNLRVEKLENSKLIKGKFNIEKNQIIWE